MLTLIHYASTKSYNQHHELKLNGQQLTIQAQNYKNNIEAC